MLVLNTVIITLFRQNKFVVVFKLINVSGIPLIAMALASFVVSLNKSMISHNLAMDNVICYCK